MVDIRNSENHTIQNLTNFLPITSDSYKSQFLNWLTLKKSIPDERFEVNVKSSESNYDKSTTKILKKTHSCGLFFANLSYTFS